MIEWYTLVFNTANCELTPLMSLSIYGPFCLVIMVVMSWFVKR